MMKLADSDRDAYYQQGYLIVKNCFSPEIIEQLKSTVKSFFLSAYHKQATTEVLSDSAFNDLAIELYNKDFAAYLGAAKLANHCIPLFQLAVNQRLVNLLQQLDCQMPAICARPLMWFHSPKVASTPRYAQLPAHQEWSNMQGSLNGIVAWSPLLTITPDMGRLQIIPGSHLHGLHPFQSEQTLDYPFMVDGEHYNEQDFIEVDVDVGDCLLFSAFLMHRSGINQSETIRWTMNFRYNDALEQSFIQRHYPDPFQFHANEQLIDDFQPEQQDLQALFAKPLSNME